MKFSYNVTGEARKDLTKAIGTLLKTEPVYLKAPTYAYDIGGYIVDKEGTLTTPEGASRDEAFRVVDGLFAEYGYKPVGVNEGLFPEDEEEQEEEPEEVSEPEEESEDEVAAEVTNEMETETDVIVDPPESQPEPAEGELPDEEEKAPESPLNGPDKAGIPAEDDAPRDVQAEEDPTHLTLSLPREKFSDEAIGRLKALVNSMQGIFKKAFEADELPIIVNDKEILFPWFTLHNVEGEVDAYAKFIFAIAKRALTATRISEREKPTDNAKFTMRLFLNSLGFKGEEYKFARRFLIRNLDGNGAWRYGNGPSDHDVDLELPSVYVPDKTEETVAKREELDEGFSET